MSLGIGSEIWMRVDTRDAPEGFRACWIIGETSRSWLVARWPGAASTQAGDLIPKTGSAIRCGSAGRSGQATYYVERAAVDDAIWLRANRRRILDAVENSPVPVWRAIDAILGESP